jgi:hypothetical protein
VVTAEAGRIEWTSAMGRPEERGRAASRVEMTGEGGGGGGRGRWEGREWGAGGTARWPLLVRQRPAWLPMYVWIQKQRENRAQRRNRESREREW